MATTPLARSGLLSDDADAFTGVSGHRFGQSNYGRSASNGPPVFVTGYVSWSSFISSFVV
jgi:hypothetical protein